MTSAVRFVRVDVAHAKSGHFRHPTPGRVEHLQDRAIAFRTEVLQHGFAIALEPLTDRADDFASMIRPTADPRHGVAYCGCPETKVPRQACMRHGLRTLCHGPTWPWSRPREGEWYRVGVG